MADRCQDVEPLLSGWLDGELPAATHRRVEDHVAGCDRCRADGDSLRAVRSLVRSMPVRRLPPAAQPTAPAGAARADGRVVRAGMALVVAVGLLGGGAFALGGEAEDVPVVTVPMDLYVADHVVQTVQAPLHIPALVGTQP
jgi:anti-sigma factor RsiW